VGAFSIIPVVITLIVAGASINLPSDREALTTTVSSYAAGWSGFSSGEAFVGDACDPGGGTAGEV
jgi:hypothetical protein